MQNKITKPQLPPGIYTTKAVVYVTEGNYGTHVTTKITVAKGVHKGAKLVLENSYAKGANKGINKGSS